MSAWKTPCMLVLLAASLGCQPSTPCDANQFYAKSGYCGPCPDDSVAVGDICVCNDPKYRWDWATDSCIPGADAATPAGDPLPEAGTQLDAASSAPVQGCGEFCLFGRECVADNELAAGAVGPSLAKLGLGTSDDSACVTQCNETAVTPADAQVLSCVTKGRTNATCAGKDDLPGAQEALSVYDGCCAKHSASPVCRSLCSAFADTVVASQLSFCK